MGAPEADHDGDDGDELDQSDASDEAGDDHLLVPQPLPSTTTEAAAVAMGTPEADKMDLEGGGPTSPRQAMNNLDLAGQRVVVPRGPPVQRRAGPLTWQSSPRSSVMRRGS